MTELFDKTLGDWLEHFATTTPDQPFIVYADRDLRFTYAEFNQRVNQFANGLLQIGVRPGHHVGIWATNVPDWNTLLFATAKIGAVLVTINTNYKQHELEYLVKHADIHTLCISNGTFESDFVEMTYQLAPELKTQARGYMESEKFPLLKNVVYLGPEKHRGMYNTAEVMQIGMLEPHETLQTLRNTFDAHSVCNMQYTSGTTGFPKGVMLSHYNIANNGYCIGQRMNYTAADKVCLPVPLFHCFGIVLGMMAVVTNGATAVMLERFDPLRVLASIDQEKCTSLYGVPTMFIAELHHPMFHLFDMSSLRTGIMAGALCPESLMTEVFEKMNMRQITSVYGLTETSPGMTQSFADDSFEVKTTTVGSPLPFIDVKVIDPDTLEECPVGVQGEMCCKGYNLMKGYYKNPEASAEIVDKNGYLHSGDLGIMDEQGNFRITGRIKDMIIRGGENIYPREIEEFLYQIEAIKDVQIVGIPSEKYGEEVGAFIILKEDADLHESDVIDFCKGKIARFKVPKYVFFLTEYPQTASGKIQKFKLKDIAAARLAQA